jgi:TPR repeat protein
MTLSQFCLGRMYREGDGVPVDLAKAAGYYRQAAVQSDAKAQYELARMLLAGEGVQPDVLQSFAWFSIASDGGNTPAQGYVSALAGKLTAKELDAAKQLIPGLKAGIKEPPADTPFLNQLR